MTLICILRICSVLLVGPTITENGGRINGEKIQQRQNISIMKLKNCRYRNKIDIC